MRDRPVRILLVGVLLSAIVFAGGCGKTSAEKPAGEPREVFPAGPDLGAAQAEFPPDDAALLTDAWGVVADGQLGIIAADSADAAAVSKAVATALGGTVTGEIAFVRMYQISFPAKGAAGLSAALETAGKVAGVELAFPDQAVYRDLKITGTPCSPVKDDAAYSGDRGRPYEMIGVENAWAIMGASGLELNQVHVGITDDGLYRPQGEFDGDTEFETKNPEDQLGGNRAADDPLYGTVGSHGTAVAGIIGANPANGGQVGVASNIGKKMKVTMTNIFKGKYANDTTAVPDPNDPTQYQKPGGAWTISSLAAIADQIKGGSTIINCSWGSSNADPLVAAAYKRFFEKMSVEHPGVLFVCSAGNNGKALDGTKRYPSGLNLPNMITVGCLDNDGSPASYSNRSSGNFTVDISAPGHRVVSGVGDDGDVGNDNGGTSFATPQVTAAAAMLRTLDPSLSAADIKDILLTTGTTSFTDPKTGVTTRVPAGVGGSCVAIDRAVLKVVNKLRTKAGLAPLTMDDVKRMNSVNLTAEGDGDAWDVSATLPGSEDGAEAALRVVGEAEVEGDVSQPADSSTSADWGIAPEDVCAIAHVKRSDSGACSKVILGVQPFLLSDAKYKINGEPSGGENAVARAFPGLEIRVAPSGDKVDTWKVAGYNLAYVDGMKMNAQTFYGPVSISVKGEFDPATGVMNADMIVKQNIRYDRMTGYDKFPRTGWWTDVFKGEIEVGITQDSEHPILTFEGEHEGEYQSQADDKHWDAGDSDGAWFYSASYTKTPLQK